MTLQYTQLAGQIKGTAFKGVDLMLISVWNKVK